MRAIPKIFLGVSLLCAVGLVRAEVIAPDTLMQNTVQEVLAVVKQDKDIQSGNQAKVLALVDAKVLPHFDFLRMTRLSVGKYWRTASEDQKQALVKEFRTMLVRTYTKAFTSYRDQTIEVKPVKMAADDTEVTVKTNILKPGAPSVSVDYEMEKTPDGWKVFDLSIEGAGLVPTYRSTFAKQIEDGGIDGLIKTLADKNANSAMTKAATN
ncbi:MAG: ABC transporter substrate-binding protein [Gallionella sp.]|nr:ABC transporter substrate-binding protein [Gallionella sp.]